MYMRRKPRKQNSVPHRSSRPTQCRAPNRVNLRRQIASQLTRSKLGNTDPYSIDNMHRPQTKKSGDQNKNTSRGRSDRRLKNPEIPAGKTAHPAGGRRGIVLYYFTGSTVLFRSRSRRRRPSSGDSSRTSEPVR
jgi:hypothetical protein